MGLRASVRRTVVVVAASTLLLTGCGGEEPEPKLPASSSPAPSPTRSEKPKSEKEAVEAFVREWAAESTRMLNTGDTERYAAMSANCDPCMETVERVERTYAAGGLVKSGQLKLSSFSSGRLPGRKSKWTVELTIHDPGTEYTESAGGEVQSYPPMTNRNSVDVETAGGRLRVTDFRQFVR